MPPLPYGMPNQVSKGTTRPGCTLLPECLVERAEHRGARESGGSGKSSTSFELFPVLFSLQVLILRVSADATWSMNGIARAFSSAGEKTP